MLFLEIYKQPQKFLANQKKLHPTSKIVDVIEDLWSNPKPYYTKKLVGYKDLYRIKIEKYKIIYNFDEKNLYIYMIRKRDEIYIELKRLALF